MHPGKRVFGTREGELKASLAPGFRHPIRPERIDIDPEGIGQDCLKTN